MKAFEFRVVLALVAVASAAVLSASPVLAQSCAIRSGKTAAPVVELYTSEGCNSCPPADRWLSQLKSDRGVVALAFHVDYWDRLGWRDRFASPAYSERQAQEARRNGASFSYTPQVVLNGGDYKSWHRLTSLSSLPATTATVEVLLERSDAGYSGTITPSAAAPARLAAYWAVTELEHWTAVKAGENKGVRLTHDFVVREYQPVAPWTAQRGAVLHFKAKNAADAAHPRLINLVVTDAKSGKPLQAVKLSCAQGELP